MYKIMIYINTYSGDKWFYYQENEKDYIARSLHEIKETVLTLIDTYGKDNIKIVKQITGEDMEGSVETFIYDSTDNCEELVNRPSINGVEIIGALSLAELGIQPAGDYAVNTKVSELEQAIGNIDLSPYATNERVDQVEVKVDAIDLEPYATIDYLDEVVAGIDFSASNENITGVKTFSVLPRSTVTPVAEDELTNKSYVDHEILDCATEEYVDTALDEYIPCFTFPNWVSAFQSVSLAADQLPVVSKMITDNLGKIAKAFVQVTGVNASGLYFGKVYSSKPTIISLYSYIPVNKAGLGVQIRVYIQGAWDGDTFTCTSAILEGGQEESFLTWWTALAKNNTRAFTPTGDYNPATKKYVDDSIASIKIPEIGSDAPKSAIYQLNTTKYLSVPATYTNEDMLATISEAFTKYFNGETGIPSFRVTATDPMCLNPDYYFNLHLLNGLTATYYAYKLSNTTSATGYSPTLYIVKMEFTLTNTDDIYTTSKVELSYATRGEMLLTTKNTIQYTPTSYYHPATKKYVDDSIAAIDISTGLDNYYTKEEVDAAIAAAITGALGGEY